MITLDDYLLYKKELRIMFPLGRSACQGNHNSQLSIINFKLER